MKKSILLLTSIFLLMSLTKAQESTIGFTVGSSFSSYKINVQSVSVISKTQPGITVGVVSFIGLTKHLSLMNEFNFTQKGGSFTGQGGSEKIITNYLEVPVNLIYSMPARSGNLFAGAGPSLTMGVSGKYKWSDATGSGSAPIKFGTGSDFKAFDAGINFLAGYQLNSGLLISVNYNAGLTNFANTDPQSEGAFHNRYFGLRFGYVMQNWVKYHKR